MIERETVRPFTKRCNTSSPFQPPGAQPRAGNFRPVNAIRLAWAVKPDFAYEKCPARRVNNTKFQQIAPLNAEHRGPQHQTRCMAWKADHAAGRRIHSIPGDRMVGKAGGIQCE